MSAAKSSKKAPSAAKSALASKGAAASPKPKTALGAQYKTTLMSGEPETITTQTTQTRTVSRAVTAPASGVVSEVPFARLTRPKTLKPPTAPAPAAPVAVATTTCTTEVVAPATVEGVEERLTSLGYEPVMGLVAGGKLEAVYAIAPLGQKVLVRVDGQPAKAAGESYVRVEGADDPVAPEEIGSFFLRKLITEASLGGRIDTDFAIMTPDGVSIWEDDGTSAAHWLYDEDDAASAARLTGLGEGWFVLSSVTLSSLKEPDTRQKTIVDRLYDVPSDPETGEPVATFRVLIQLLRMAGLLEPLRSAGPFTLLAPDDRAFARLDDATARSLVTFANRDKLASILEYHIYANRQDSARVGEEPTVQGEIVSWDKTVDPITADEASVMYVDLEASNGIVHVLGGVLMPKTPSAGTLTALVEPTSSDDIDYTTQRIRQVLAGYNGRRIDSIGAMKDKLDEALSELADAGARIVRARQEVLDMTQEYNRISERPQSRKAALALAGEISLANDRIDASLMGQNEEADLLAQLADITAQARALTARMRKAGMGGV